MKKIISYGFLLLLLQSCGGREEAASNPGETKQTALSSGKVQLTDKQIQYAGIRLGTAEIREMHLSLQVNGNIDVHPDNQISISAPLGGYLKKTTLIPGTKVAKGSVLAILEDQQYIQLQQDYLTAKNKLQYLETDYKRQKDLNETKVASDKTLQQVQGEYNNQRILVHSFAERLRLIGLVPEKLNENSISRSIAIHSPISGYVVKVNANIGKYINPSDVIFELINPTDVCVNLTVFENDATRLKIGQVVKFTTSNNPEKVFLAKVELISPNIDMDRSTQVHATLSQSTSELLPGTFINAEIELNKAKVSCIPDEALVRWEGKDYVFVEETKGSYRMTPVTIGNSNEGSTELKSQLPAKNIVIKGAYTLLMKLKNKEE
ncbi:efflux RND transporter periplasmic adaptor subunit [Fluviicola sp.]|jgi:cobalt-zinc-cadmium efflux system membrane fusion protein|uniref:efflux RND transporter periplasmic adaptor subunit n=1 Tax=Fluviicola sp. TaxID=1917219 RepID=UPI002830AA93|nr:efflux RND transporter periplasmic adaptor subunit [Fluviicola sp.]MDR0801895.1 efflux RND transporter periplasmic adaptor subunit [Fluviicola sp.]